MAGEGNGVYSTNLTKDYKFNSIKLPNLISTALLDKTQYLRNSSKVIFFMLYTLNNGNAVQCLSTTYNRVIAVHVANP